MYCPPQGVWWSGFGKTLPRRTTGIAPHLSFLLCMPQIIQAHTHPRSIATRSRSTSSAMDIPYVVLQEFCTTKWFLMRHTKPESTDSHTLRVRWAEVGAEPGFHAILVFSHSGQPLQCFIRRHKMHAACIAARCIKFFCKFHLTF